MPAPDSSLQRAHLLPLGRQGARWGAKRDKAPVLPQGAQRLERKGDPPGTPFTRGGARATPGLVLPAAVPACCGPHTPWSCARGSCAVPCIDSSSAPRPLNVAGPRRLCSPIPQSVPPVPPSPALLSPLLSKSLRNSIHLTPLLSPRLPDTSVTSPPRWSPCGTYRQQHSESLIDVGSRHPCAAAALRFPQWKPMFSASL